MEYDNDNRDSNTSLAIMRPENIEQIVKAAPQGYRDNRLSHDRCLDFGLGLLTKIRDLGMDDELDRQAATFVEKARRTVKAMNERRSPVTKLFDEVRAAFTRLENEVDPSRKGTVANDLQLLRDQYAARLRAEREARLRAEQERKRREEAWRGYRQDVEQDLKAQFDMFCRQAVELALRLESDVTIDSYDKSMKGLEAIPRELPESFLAGLRSQVFVPDFIEPVDARDAFAQIRDRLAPEFRERYAKEAGAEVGEVIDRMPSRLAKLQEMAKASAEEAARLKAEMEARQREEAERLERERAQREKAEREKAEMERERARMESLFDGQAIASAQQPKAKVTKRLRLLNPEGIMPVISLWWSKEGCSLSADELAKMFKKQITFCERLANKEDVLIRDESVEYVEEVKAK